MGHEYDGTVAPRSRSLRTANLLLRLLTIALCIPVLVLMVRSNQRILVFKAGWKDVKAFLALVILIAILLAYSALQAVLALLGVFSKALPSSRFPAWITFVCDQALTYALLGAAAASAEVAYIARNGAPKAQWPKICGTFDKFCNKAGASIILAFLAVGLLVITSAISARRLFGLHSAAASTR